SPLVTLLGRIVSRMPFAELPSPRTLITGGAAALAMVTLTLLGALDTVELGTLNRLFELRGQRSPTAPIIIVTIDEDSFHELNLPWPFPRALHGKLLDVISSGRPLVIGVDLLFPEPSPRGPMSSSARPGRWRSTGCCIGWRQLTGSPCRRDRRSTRSSSTFAGGRGRSRGCRITASWGVRYGRRPSATPSCSSARPAWSS